MDAVKETIADVSSVSLIRSDERLPLEASAIVSFKASITLINTQLIHQFKVLPLAVITSFSLPWDPVADLVRSRRFG